MRMAGRHTALLSVCSGSNGWHVSGYRHSYTDAYGDHLRGACTFGIRHIDLSGLHYDSHAHTLGDYLYGLCAFDHWHIAFPGLYYDYYAHAFGDYLCGLRTFYEYFVEQASQR